MDTKEQQKKGYRKGYLVGYSPLRLLVLLGITPVLLVGVLSATGLFSSLPSNPSGYVAGGKFSERLANIASVSCPTTPVKHFVKGFDGDYKPVCVPYNAPTTGNANVATESFSAPVAGGMPGGKFGTYFNNILNYCSGNGVLKGFTSQGQKICVDASDRTTPTDNPVLASLSASSIAYPTALPSGTSSGGTYQSFFNTMFGTSCGANKGIVKFGSDGAPVCAIMPLDGMCGSSNGQSYYTAPTTGLCIKGTQSGVSGSGPWSWTCSGMDGGGSVSCGANKKVDGGWTAWSGFSSCSASCGGGTQSSTRSCTNPSPANGGSDCSGISSQNQSCNTQACACSGATPCGTPGACYATSGCDNTCGSTKVSDCAGTCGGSAVDYNGGSAGCGSALPNQYVAIYTSYGGQGGGGVSRSGYGFGEGISTFYWMTWIPCSSFTLPLSEAEAQKVTGMYGVSYIPSHVGSFGMGSSIEYKQCAVTQGIDLLNSGGNN
ncbi:MAG: hypothetical protein PHH70_00470 [Candidatus Gracilibacteria bacterium]|nr:hypothetical protein [Candidatus Gracilibacteria bacterium]